MHSLLIPREEKYLHLRGSGTTVPPHRRKSLPCPVTAQPMRDYHNSVNEKSLYLKFQLPPMDSSFTTTPPNSIKDCFSPLFLNFRGVSLHHISRITILCCSQISPLDGEISVYLFKVNTINM